MRWVTRRHIRVNRTATVTPNDFIAGAAPQPAGMSGLARAKRFLDEAVLKCFAHSGRFLAP
jgi:hypothetical protein